MSAEDHLPISTPQEEKLMAKMKSAMVNLSLGPSYKEGRVSEADWKISRDWIRREPESIYKPEDFQKAFEREELVAKLESEQILEDNPHNLVDAYKVVHFGAQSGPRVESRDEYRMNGVISRASGDESLPAKIRSINENHTQILREGLPFFFTRFDKDKAAYLEVRGKNDQKILVEFEALSLKTEDQLQVSYHLSAKLGDLEDSGLIPSGTFSEEDKALPLKRSFHLFYPKANIEDGLTNPLARVYWEAPVETLDVLIQKYQPLLKKLQAELESKRGGNPLNQGYDYLLLDAPVNPSNIAEIDELRVPVKDELSKRIEQLKMSDEPERGLVFNGEHQPLTQRVRFQVWVEQVLGISFTPGKVRLPVRQQIALNMPGVLELLAKTLNDIDDATIDKFKFSGLGMYDLDTVTDYLESCRISGQLSAEDIQKFYRSLLENQKIAKNWGSRLLSELRKLEIFSPPSP